MSKRSVMVVFLAFALVLLASSVCLAADQGTAKMTVRIDLTDKYFWTYPYISAEGKILKPTAVVVEWSQGTSSKFVRQTVVVPDKIEGEYVIVTEKGAIINLQVSVVDAGNTVLGGGSLQVRNNGQREKFYIALPDKTSPVVSRDLGRPE